MPNESKNIFQNKLCNIIEPINESNNLGKSIKEIDDPFL